MTMRWHVFSQVVAALSMSTLLFSCGGADPVDLGKLNTKHASPTLPESTLSVAPYKGDNDIVLTAQDLYYDGFALHARVIQPTCGPINGVCHNAKEYPDMHTPANFASAVEAPCNIQAGTPEGIFDRCERPGDRFKFSGDDAELEVGYLEYVPGDLGDNQSPDAQSPGLHIYLAGKITRERQEFYGDAQFIRTFINDQDEVEDLPYFTFSTHFYILSDASYDFGDGESGTHLFAQVREYQQGDIEALLSVGVVEGDANHNGILGARQDGNPIKLIERGDPEGSYLVGRMRGTLRGEIVPGSRMPLANEPLDNAEMLGLYCFIEGLARRPGAVNMKDPIDYQNCSFTQNPEQLELLGAGVTWDGRIKRILEFNCGGCHGGSAPQAGLNLKDDDVYARVMQASSQLPSLKLIEPGQTQQSYLWLKVNADPSIMGSPMPIDPLNGDRRLTAQELADLRTWIEEGALPGGDGDADAGM